MLSEPSTMNDYSVFERRLSNLEHVCLHDSKMPSAFQVSTSTMHADCLATIIGLTLSDPELSGFAVPFGPRRWDRLYDKRFRSYRWARRILQAEEVSHNVSLEESRPWIWHMKSIDIVERMLVAIYWWFCISEFIIRLGVRYRLEGTMSWTRKLTSTDATLISDGVICFNRIEALMSGWRL